MKLTWRLSFSTFRMDRKQVQCLDCGKKLSSRDRLKQHMATQHSDNPPTFTCQCGKVFKSQRGLKSHEMLHTGVIKCGLCPFEGTHGEQMRAHLRSQHGADRLQCTQCDTTFTHRSSLTQHIVWHSLVYTVSRFIVGVSVAFWATIDMAWCRLPW